MTQDNKAPLTPLFSPSGENVPLVQLAYVSTQRHAMDTADMLELLQQARRANDASGITGVLLHKQHSFFQILEGTAEDVSRTFASICRDPRHHSIEILNQSGLSDREYPDWRMGFIDLDNVDMRLLKGYTDFMLDTEEPREFLTHLSKSKKLAIMFRSLS
jgi:hypothetical protein